MKNSLIVFLIMTSFISFGQTKQAAIIAVHYQTKEFDCAIFTATHKKEFTPSMKQIDTAESILEGQLSTILPVLNDKDLNGPSVPYKNIKEFKRQYFGYIDKKGHRILLINCFCQSDSEYRWLKEMILVDDGGSCYWNIKLDLNTGKLFDMHVNGVA